MGLLDQYSVDAVVREKAGTAIKSVTIAELYVFLLKLLAAGFLVCAPLTLVIWFLNYALTH